MNPFKEHERQIKKLKQNHAIDAKNFRNEIKNLKEDVDNLNEVTKPIPKKRRLSSLRDLNKGTDPDEPTVINKSIQVDKEEIKSRLFIFVSASYSNSKHKLLN